MSAGRSSFGSVETPILPRLENAVVTLRHQFERHQRQEHRLHSYYLGLQDSWRSHVHQMSAQLTMLEGLLATWVPATVTAPQLSVVTGPEGD